MGQVRWREEALEWLKEVWSGIDLGPAPFQITGADEAGESCCALMGSLDGPWTPAGHADAYGDDGWPVLEVWLGADEGPVADCALSRPGSYGDEVWACDRFRTAPAEAAASLSEAVRLWLWEECSQGLWGAGAAGEAGLLFERDPALCWRRWEALWRAVGDLPDAKAGPAPWPQLAAVFIDGAACDEAAALLDGLEGREAAEMARAVKGCLLGGNGASLPAVAQAVRAGVPGAEAALAA